MRSNPFRTACLAIGLAALLPATAAKAQEFTLQLEPAASFLVDGPQDDRFTPGGYVAVRPGIAVGSVLAFQWSYALLINPAKGDYTKLGTAHFVTAGVRLRPFGTIQKSPSRVNGLFADLNLGYVRTGDLNRFGFDTGLGYNFEISPGFALGPVVRYGQIVQPDDQSNNRLLADPNDAQFVSVGINLGFGQVHKVPEQPEPLECPEGPECPVARTEPVAPVRTEGMCQDGDKDGLCDAEDRCPTVSGPPGAIGCPVNPCTDEPLTVLVQFPYDSADMPALKAGKFQTMDPVLDAVADAIAKEPSCRVCVVGFASEEGPLAYNQELSEVRASAVASYLSARGVSTSRIPSAGLGDRCQLDPVATRSLNRRVEFHRLLEGQSCPSTCAE